MAQIPKLINSTLKLIRIDSKTNSFLLIKKIKMTPFSGPHDFLISQTLFANKIRDIKLYEPKF